MAKAMVLLLAVIVGGLPGAQAVAADDIRQERVHFKAGASSATIKGAIKGDESVDYVLDAQAGQKLTASLKTSNASGYFNVLPPGSETALFVGSTSGNEWTGTLPASGDYILRVYLMRNAARRNEKASYTLDVAITGDGGAASPGAAKPAGTP